MWPGKMATCRGADIMEGKGINKKTQNSVDCALDGKIEYVLRSTDGFKYIYQIMLVGGTLAYWLSVHLQKIEYLF